MNALILTATDFEPQTWFAGLVGVVFAVSLIDLGIAFLMRGTDEAAGDERH